MQMKMSSAGVQMLVALEGIDTTIRIYGKGRLAAHKQASGYQFGICPRVSAMGKNAFTDQAGWRTKGNNQPTANANCAQSSKINLTHQAPHCRGFLLPV